MMRGGPWLTSAHLARLLGVIGFAGAGFISAGHAAIGSVEAGVLTAIADYVTPTSDVLTPVLNEVGYEPVSVDAWRSFPAVRKLEEVYRAAEAAQTGGGSRALASIAAKMSARYDSVRNSSIIREFIVKNGSVDPIRFDTNAPRTMVQVTTDARSALISLAVEAEGKLGGYYRILMVDFGLSADIAFRILATSPDARSALIRGLGEVPLEQQTSRLRDLVTRAKAAYPALASDPRILAFERSNKPVEPAIDKQINRARDLVRCYCGLVYLGVMPKSLCVPGTRC